MAKTRLLDKETKKFHKRKFLFQIPAIILGIVGVIIFVLGIKYRIKEIGTIGLQLVGMAFILVSVGISLHYWFRK